MITFALCLLYIALIYIRPGEILPALAAYRILAIVLGLCVASAAGSLFMRLRRFANLPNDLCFFGFFVATIVSNPANGRFEVGPEGLDQLIPLIAFYPLIRIAVQTERQMRWLIGLVILLTLFQAGNGILQHVTGKGIGGSTAVLTPMDNGAPDDPNDPDAAGVSRVRGTGIFGDPNDLAMALVFVFPFLFTAVLRPDGGITRRVFALVALAVLSYAIYLTQSRGGFVGLAALGAAYVYRRFGRLTAGAAAVVLIIVVLLAPGRIREVSSSEASAQGRIQAWAAGIEMFKSGPVLGVGAGKFTAHHIRVAHNSFVHVFAETGMVGLFCFVGMFYWFFVTNGSLRDVAGAAASPRARDLWAGCIGITVCACFLSRQYVPILYIPLALGAARLSIEQPADQELSFQQWWDWVLLAIVTVAVVAAAFVAARSLAV